MADNFASLVETFKNVGVSMAYGAPVQLGGQEIVPAAVVIFGFGGGSEAADRDSSAGGGGGGGLVVPVGVYRSTGSQVEFRPNPIAVLFFLAPVIVAAGAAIRMAGRR